MLTPEQAFIKATKFRAKAYYYLFKEIADEVGVKNAEKIFSRATYKLGIDKSGTFRKEALFNPGILADEFVKDGIGKKVFKQKILEKSGKKALIEMRNCPLVEMWKEMKLPSKIIQKLCDCAHQIDYGTVEGKKLKLKFPERISYGKKRCVLEISK